VQSPPDVAVVDAAYEVSGARGAQGQSLPALRGRYVDIWVKRAGKWHIVADRPVVPAPTAKQ
jgi:ketosteroid isomerase-like protein